MNIPLLNQLTKKRKRKNSLKNREMFERVMLPHIESAFNLASWLVSNKNDAEDIVQESYLKAFRSFDSYADRNSHAWILTIVRNTSYTWLNSNKRYQLNNEFDEDHIECDNPATQLDMTMKDPYEWQVIQADIQSVHRAIDTLPVKQKEIIILREIEGCSYKELAEILDIAPGTVMSRVSRARQMLLIALKQAPAREKSHEL